MRVRTVKSNTRAVDESGKVLDKAATTPAHDDEDFPFLFEIGD